MITNKIPQNYSSAYMWSNLAAAQKILREYLASKCKDCEVREKYNQY